MKNIKTLQDKAVEEFEKKFTGEIKMGTSLWIQHRDKVKEMKSFLRSSILSTVQTAFAETAVERERAEFGRETSWQMEHASGWNEALDSLSHNQAEFLNNIK